MKNYAPSRYRDQKSSAQKRGISYNLTFDQWYNWWLQHGVDKNLKPEPFTKVTLCMCRFNDIGPYDLSNIYCASVEQNSKDLWTNGFRHRTDQKDVLKKSWKPVQTPLGTFRNVAEAARSHNVSPNAIWKRLTNKHPGYRLL